MAEPLQIHTERLVLRPWRREDREPFFLMGSDPEVREYFPDLVSREASDAAADRYEAHFRQHGWGRWVVEIPGQAPFIGFTGLSAPRERHHFCPCIEIAWSLARPYWGRGYATEAARAALVFGFEEAGLEEIVAFTALANERSARVMRRIGMRFSEEFDHPALAAGHWLRRHVLYRLKREECRAVKSV